MERRLRITTEDGETIETTKSEGLVEGGRIWSAGKLCEIAKLEEIPDDEGQGEETPETPESPPESPESDGSDVDEQPVTPPSAG